MKTFFHLYFFGLFLWLAPGNSVLAQTLTDASPVLDVLETDYKMHHLYKGQVFVANPQRVTGSPSFGNLEMMDDGWVVYDGVLYEDVPLMYNLVRGILISRHPKNLAYLTLEKHLVSQFGFDVYSFVQIQTGHSDLSPGFYQVLYQSDGFVAYAKRSKTIEIHTYGSVTERSFRESVSFYVDDLQTDEGFIAIARQRDLLNLLPEHRRSVRNLLRSLGLRFRPQPAESLFRTLDYLDQVR